MSSDKVGYRFGTFEADPCTGQLLRQSRPVRLQDQPFQILVTLLKANGAVVTRDELSQQLWRQDTFVEFDKSLGVALAKLRAALGDDAANPRFIETVPKRGYRFIAPITVVDGAPPPDEAARESAPAPDSPPRSTAIDARPPSTAVAVRPRLWAGLTASIVVLVAAVGAFSFRHFRTDGGLTARTAIVVANFTNATGDGVFDGSLRRLTMMGLAQSPYLHVLSDGTLGEILQGLGRPPDQPLTSGLARDACRRAGAAAIVDGSIARVGREYLLVVQASRCDDGGLLAQERVGVGSRDQIVATLGGAISDLRRRLGEPSATLQSYNAPIEVATTDSPEALRAYQLGMELRARADNIKAIPALKTAIALDPQFAVAYAQLGSSYSNMGNAEEGTPFFRKAFELRDRATAPERFYITGRYFDIVTGDLEKASETYRAWTEIYPEDWLGFNALANDANLMGRYDVAATASRRTIALEPNRSFGYVNLIIALVALHRFDDAKAACRQALEHFPDSSSAHLMLYALGVFQKDEAALARERAWAKAHPDRSEILFAQGEIAAFEGRPRQAAQLFDEAARRQRDAGSVEAPADLMVNAAEFDMFLGRVDTAVETANQALQMTHNEVVLGLGALVNALGGRDRAAERLLQEAAERHPLSTMTMAVYAPMARAVLEARRPGATPDPVARALAPGVPYEVGQEAALAPPYIRGVESLRFHAFADAARAFQQAIDHVGVDPVSPIYPLAYLGLARAEAGLGRRDESRQAYAIVLDLWKDAEPDFAPLVDARRESAALR